ncbi:MAG: hypothetical protein ACI8QQ_003117, partial [Psychroserpens sp.]
LRHKYLKRVSLSIPALLLVCVVMGFSPQTVTYTFLHFAFPLISPPTNLGFGSRKKIR